MKAFRTFLRSVLGALCMAGLVSALPALAMPVPAPVTPLNEAFAATPVASDCYAIGQQVAAQKGGTLAKASQSTQGGRPVCVIVVLVPGKEGERPRRSEIVVPLN
ncbi:MAG: hypothetical protein ABS35_03895 [Kaistia sp. SCN 65-12]|nr:MAG: hypothetical protein ABS35_03895 [Kaistia sp. SCN 65-12]